MLKCKALRRLMVGWLIDNLNWLIMSTGWLVDPQHDEDLMRMMLMMVMMVCY